MASIEIDIRDEEPSVLVFSGSSTFELVLGSVSVTMTIEQFDKLCEQMRAWIVEYSTAHTSEARDSEVAELIEATRRLTADIEFRIDDPRSQLLDRARRATTAAVGCNCPGSAKVSYLSHAPNCPAREALGKFAAMRQEAGDA